MKLKYFIATVVGVAALVACSDGASTYTVRGEIAGETDGVIYLKRYDDKSFTVVDSAKIEDGKFVFSGLFTEPMAYGLTTNRETRRPLLFFIDKGETAVNVDENENTIAVIGSPSSDIYLENAPLVRGDGYSLDSLIQAHPSSPVPAFFLMRDFTWRLSLDEIKQLRQKFDASLNGTTYIDQIDTFTSRLEHLKVGELAPDFTLPDSLGNSVSLSDFRGKYLLVDFWASWCPDCRRENPNVVEAYNRFNQRNFTILGVSLDRERAPWLAAIEKDGLSWTHVTDLKDWKSDAAVTYAIRWIPTSYLISPDGHILAVGLEGEALLNKLDEVLPK
jgi:peroxiredoxin